MLAIAKQVAKSIFSALGIKIRRNKPAPKPAAVLASLDPNIRSALLSMYDREDQAGIDGEKHSLDGVTSISASQGMWLYDLCLLVKPKSVLEIGMAYGYSTLYFLAALNRNKVGTLTSIDPFQRSAWHGIGLVHANAHAATSSVFHLVEDRSDRAAVDLIRSNSSYDIIFIDGNHRFDDVLVDFYLCAQLCALGGRLVFDDMWMPSIKTVVSFVRTNRTDFIELPTAEANISVFQRVGDDCREWTNFVKF
jgi:predicted O-methyltransferase YrrM